MNILKSIYYTIFSPKKAFERINENPKWIGLSIVCGMFFLILLYFNAISIRRFLESSISKELITSVLNIIKVKQINFYFIQIMCFYLEILIFSLFSWMLIKIFSVQINFRNLLSLIVHSKIILILETLLISLIIFLRSGQHISALYNFRINIGLGLLLKGDTYPEIVYFFLNSINVITLWWGFVLFKGLCVLGSVSKRKSIFTVVIMYLLLIFIRIFLSYFDKYVQVNFF
jgi:hypothetical protein